jgi:hypothetical protein
MLKLFKSTCLSGYHLEASKTTVKSSSGGKEREKGEREAESFGAKGGKL